MVHPDSEEGKAAEELCKAFINTISEQLGPMINQKDAITKASIVLAALLETKTIILDLLEKKYGIVLEREEVRNEHGQN
jgi:hypothetical protein